MRLWKLYSTCYSVKENIVRKPVCLSVFSKVRQIQLLTLVQRGRLSSLVKALLFWEKTRARLRGYRGTVRYKNGWADDIKDDSCLSSYRDGKEIKAADGERVSIVRTRAERGCYELVIADVCADDAGTYTCNAINIYGDCVTEAKVTVVGESYKQKTALYNYSIEGKS